MCLRSPPAAVPEVSILELFMELLSILFFWRLYSVSFLWNTTTPGAFVMHRHSALEECFTLGFL